METVRQDVIGKKFYVDYIITRNIKDFARGEITAV